MGQTSRRAETRKDIHEIQVGNSYSLMEDQVPVQGIKMVLSRLMQEIILPTQNPNKRHTVNLSTEGQETLGKDRGATMSSQETAPDSLELDMDKLQLNLEMADIENPVLVKPVTVWDTPEIQIGVLRQLTEDLVPAQGINMVPPMVRQGTVIGTQRPIKGATMRDTPEIQVGILRQLMKDLVPAQEINMDLPMAILETVLGAQSPIKRDIVNLSMEGQDPALGQGRGVTMSSQETAPDSLELDMDNPQLDMEAGNIGNPVLVRPVTVKDIQKTQVDGP